MYDLIQVLRTTSISLQHLLTNDTQKHLQVWRPSLPFPSLLHQFLSDANLLFNISPPFPLIVTGGCLHPAAFSVDSR